MDIGDHDENFQIHGDSLIIMMSHLRIMIVMLHIIGQVVLGEGRGSLMGVHWKGRADLKGSMGGVGLLISYGGDFKGGAVRANMGHVRRIK